ncbi:class I adenylate cyclase [Atopomonas sediminilitoris]|uniref:class I adenylate cyclase n=1 Tax=Atopomonas sediminilitoris TaxID=2919919 RepID=UPI001F4F0C54|nr:class I adenylate cyclase [Atopomonas sediminilitoris]
MVSSPEIRPQIDDGIDRKTLTQLRERFLKVNAGRLDRAQQALPTRQQLVLTLLPLLFHVNHPLLPGYVSGSTPAGLSLYEPDERVLQEVARLTRSFAYKRQRNAPTPIWSLFLMGSMGTVAHSDHSDLDLWVCHDPALNSRALDELARKCELLTLWAASLGAETNFYLVNPEQFARGQRTSDLSAEDCGSAQHYLLLDEFYRTAMHLAGRYPLWWLVPVYEELRYNEYCNILIDKRFIRAEETIDFGHLAYIPPGEFIGAGMWQLFKGIESPYKSVLKLLLTEVYASEHPQVECLALRFKQAVYRGQLQLDELDPYIMVYRRLEEYLAAPAERQRLELVRRCLYLKINQKLSRSSRYESWQREVVQRLANEWHWDERQLGLLDSRSQWKVRQVIGERKQLVGELTYSYRFLSQFARTQQAEVPLNRRDLGVLGRRLYAAFERKAGKVEFINPGIAPDLAEDNLSLVHLDSEQYANEPQWALYQGTLGSNEWFDYSPLKRSRDLISLLAWCQRNGVIDSGTRLALHPGQSELGDVELSQLLASLQQSFPTPFPAIPEDALLAPARPVQILLLVNIGLDPLKHITQRNLQLTTARTDSLGYSGLKENLVLTFDQITLNSWNELSVSRHDGPQALLDCLADLLGSIPAGVPAPLLDVRCFSRNRGPAISQRLHELFQEALSCHLSDLPQRLLIQVQNHFHLLDWAYGTPRPLHLTDRQELIEALGQARPSFSPISLDRHALEDDELNLVLQMGREHCVQVFYRRDNDQGTVYVLDEHNSLWQRQLSCRDDTSLLLPLQRFLNTVLFRRLHALPLDDIASPPEVLFYEIVPPPPLKAQRLERRSAPSDRGLQASYQVQALIEPHPASGREHITLYCDHREFSELEYGAKVYQAAARHILSQRQGGERYPCHLTDLDLSRLFNEAQTQTVHYLRYKRDIEDTLNKALQRA